MVTHHMDWLFYALAAPALYTGVNFIDKFILKTGRIDYRGMPLYTALVSALFGTVAWPLTGFAVPGFRDTVIIMLTGMLTLWASVFYFKAVYRETTSKVIILLQMVPLLVLVLSWVFLDETLSGRQLTGFALIFAAAVALVQSDGSSAGFSLASFLLIVTADLMWAVSSILLKIAVAHNTVSQLFVYQSWGAGLGGLLLFLVFPDIRRAFFSDHRVISVRTFGLVFLNEGVFVTSKLANIAAVFLGPVTLVSVMGGTQVFFGIVFGRVLTRMAPQIYNEDITAKGLLKEIFSAAAMFCGIWLLH